MELLATTSLTTYRVTITGPFTARVESVEPFMLNRIPHQVNATGEYIPADDLDGRYRPASFHLTWSHRPIERIDGDRPMDTTENARQKIRDDINAAVVPLFSRPDVIQGGLRAAFDAASQEARHQAAKLRQQAAELLITAEKAETFAARQDAQATYAADLEIIDPAAIIAAARERKHDYRSDYAKQDRTRQLGFDARDWRHEATFAPAYDAWDVIKPSVPDDVLAAYCRPELGYPNPIATAALSWNEAETVSDDDLIAAATLMVS